ncbi:MAG TPA: DUF2892 domain-containing protein [Thermoanaerobaculia bacterium]|nr:DUF2892 domain-containing protein [Thermoanaerobaculia bacterium]
MNRLFPRNEHTIERFIRVILGAAILSLAFVGPATPWAYLGVIPIATGLLGSCPLYTLLGISTCPLKTRSA